MKNINVNKNNQKSCEVEEKVINEDAVVNISVDEKIDKLFNTNGYVFSKNVEIVTNISSQLDISRNFRLLHPLNI